MNKKIINLLFFLFSKTLSLKQILSNAFWWRYNKILINNSNCEVGTHFVSTGRLNLKISNESSVSIGHNVTIKSGRNNNPLSRNIETTICTEKNAVLKIGSNCGISSSCIWAHSLIEIGDFVMIGANTIIMDSDAHSLKTLDRINSDIDQHNKINKPIIIESHVLIGVGVIVLKGVKIGKGSVIGSGSVITKDIPCNVIAAGNPARVIRSL